MGKGTLIMEELLNISCVCKNNKEWPVRFSSNGKRVETNIDKKEDERNNKMFK